MEAFYAARNYAPLWIADGQLDARAKSVIARLANSAADGLDPADYQIPAFGAATGVMPLEEFKREHLIEYNRLVASGELSQYLVDAPSQPVTRASTVLGFTLMACGLLLLAMVINGFTHHLFGG